VGREPDARQNGHRTERLAWNAMPTLTLLAAVGGWVLTLTGYLLLGVLTATGHRVQDFVQAVMIPFGLGGLSWVLSIGLAIAGVVRGDRLVPAIALALVLPFLAVVGLGLWFWITYGALPTV